MSRDYSLPQSQTQKFYESCIILKYVVFFLSWPRCGWEWRLVISSLPRILDLAPCARAALLALCLKGGLRTPALGSTDAFHYPSIWKMPVKSKLHTCLKTSVKMYIYIFLFWVHTCMCPRCETYCQRSGLVPISGTMDGTRGASGWGKLTVDFVDQNPGIAGRKPMANGLCLQFSNICCMELIF